MFSSVDENIRTFIIATNVAETSVTIANIKYVVDSGRVKEKEYSKDLAVEKYKIKWIS